MSHGTQVRRAPTGATLSRDAHHQSQGEDRGTQGRQVACPAQPELRDSCACAPGLLGCALLLCSALYQGEDRGTHGRQVACPA